MAKKLKEQLMDVGSATAVGGGSGATNQKDGTMTAKRNIGQSGEDFPYFDDTEYVTHKTLDKTPSNSASEWLDILEQNIPPADEGDIPTLPGEKTASPAVIDAEQQTPKQPDASPAGEGNIPMDDPTMANMPGMDMGMGQDQTQQLTSNEIGRIYELKKIYSRLATIETFLQEETDEKMVELRNMVSKAIELFETVISNIQVYRDKLDEIIISFYKFLDQIFEDIRTYYKGQGKEKINESTEPTTPGEDLANKIRQEADLIRIKIYNEKVNLCKTRERDDPCVKNARVDSYVAMIPYLIKNSSRCKGNKECLKKLKSYIEDYKDLDKYGRK